MRLVWRFRALIVVLALVGAIVGVMVAVRAPVVYEASVRLTMLSPDADGTGLPNARESIGASRVFGRVALSRDVLSVLVNEFDLQHRYGQTPETLVACCLTLDPLPNSDVFRLNVTLPDSDLSARVANRLVELAVQRSRVLGQAYLDFLRGQLDEARGRLDATEQQLARIRRNPRRRTALADLSRSGAPQPEHIPMTERELPGGSGRGRAQESTGPVTGAPSPVGSPAPHAVASAAPDIAEDRLALERELAARTYGDVFSQYEQARLKLASTPTLIQVITPASPPRASGKVPAVAGLVGGGIFGLLASVVLGIAWSYVTSSRRMETVR